MTPRVSGETTTNKQNKKTGRAVGGTRRHCTTDSGHKVLRAGWDEGLKSDPEKNGQAWSMKGRAPVERSR